jgi:hypothetical protein
VRCRGASFYVSGPDCGFPFMNRTEKRAGPEKIRSTAWIVVLRKKKKTGYFSGFPWRWAEKCPS